MRFGNFAAVLVAATGMAVAAGTQGHAQTVKIGLINSNTGFLAQAGDEMEKGISLYVKTHEKDLPPGVKVELIRRDDTAAPEVGKRVAQELMTRERVQALLGIVGSPIAAAVAPLTAEAKIPLVITNAAGVAIPRISPYVARVSFTLWQQAYPLGKWAAQKGWKKAYTAVSDFIPGHDSEAAFSKSFTDAGGQIVGAVRFPTTNPDFVPFVQKVKDAAPDVLFIFIPAGGQATAVMKAIKDLKLREAGISVVSTQDLVPEEELPNMGDTPVDLITSGIYSMAGQRSANAAFLAAWNAEYGTKAIPDFLSVGGWDGTAAFFDVIKQTNGKFDGDKAMAILKGWKHESPRGPIMIDPDTRDIIQNVYMRRTQMKDGKLANVEFDTIPNVKDPWKELNPPK
ncbi:MAG: ABC transporter substrate-binding protein [Bradyrhizobiaceae bacterium]|nr:ABC transporter substrate-binding protein [Bradyrhizobiaceae bacterium]